MWFLIGCCVLAAVIFGAAAAFLFAALRLASRPAPGYRCVGSSYVRVNGQWVDLKR